MIVGEIGSALGAVFGIANGDGSALGVDLGIVGGNESVLGMAVGIFCCIGLVLGCLRVLE